MCVGICVGGCVCEEGWVVLLLRYLSPALGYQLQQHHDLCVGVEVGVGVPGWLCGRRRRGVRVRVWVGVSPCVCVCLSVCLPVCLHVCLLACLPVCLSVFLPTRLPACLSACLSVCLSACLPACLSVCMSICLSVFFMLVLFPIPVTFSIFYWRFYLVCRLRMHDNEHTTPLHFILYRALTYLSLYLYRPDKTFAVDWALNNNYLFIYLSLAVPQTDWNDGYYLCAIVHSLGGTIEGWPDLDRSDQLGNCQNGEWTDTHVPL